MKRQFVVLNKSGWPTPFLQAIISWLVSKDSSLPSPITFRFKGVRRRDRWSGYADLDTNTITIGYHRRYSPPGGWPHEFVDPRVSYSPAYVVNSRIEDLVWLLAHELYHLSAQGNPERFKRGARYDGQSLEYRCNQAGWKAVQRLRKEWSKLKREIKSSKPVKIVKRGKRVNP